MKKIIAFVFTFLLVSFGLSHNAFAATLDDSSKVIADIQQANQQIEILIDNAKAQGSEINKDFDKQIIDLQTERANYAGQQDKIAEMDKKIADLKQEEAKEIDKLCQDLYNETENVANAVVAEAREAGITVEKQYFDQNIGGEIIAIDPIHVVS